MDGIGARSNSRRAQCVPEHDRGGQQQNRAGLMRGAERDRHDEQQGRDAERELQQSGSEQHMQREAGRARQRRPLPPSQSSTHAGRRRHRQQAMVELHRGDILEPVQHERLQLRIAGRHETAVHQRKRVVDQPGMQPGDKPARDDRQRDETDNRLGGAAPAKAAKLRPPPLRGGFSPPCANIPSAIHRVSAIDRQRQREMRDEAVLADRDAVGEAALDHVPAERALREAEQKNPGKRQYQPARHLPPDQETDQRQRIDETDQPPPQPMHVLPQKDRFELAEAHPGIEQLVLRDLLVFLEFGRPGGLRQRRHDAGDRLPFGDRQPGQGQPRDAADHDHQENHRAAEQQPIGDRALAAFGWMRRISRHGRKR